MFAVLMLAKYKIIALLGMHEVLIAVRSILYRCEPNKRGVSPEVGVAPKIRGASAPLIFFWKPLSSKSGYAPVPCCACAPEA